MTKSRIAIQKVLIFFSFSSHRPDAHAGVGAALAFGGGGGVVKVDACGGGEKCECNEERGNGDKQSRLGKHMGRD